MTPEELPTHYHRHVVLWLIVGFIATGVLLLMAWSGKNNRSFRLIPAQARVTPTPIVAGNIIVTTPHADEHVPQDFLVTGTTKLPVLGIRLSDKYSGHVITEGRVRTAATETGTAAPYNAELKITSETIRSEAPLILEIFEPVGDNLERNKITLPLTFTPVGQ